MNHHTDPNRDLKLGLGIAASGAIALGGACLPSSSLLANFGAVALPSIGLGGSIAAIAKANEYEHQDAIAQDARERWQALKADMDDAMLLSSQAFYTHNPQAWIEGRNVPPQWHTEYLRTRFSPLPEPQFQTEQIAPKPLQQQGSGERSNDFGRVRGGSFDVSEGFAPKHPQAPQSFESFTAPDDAWIDGLIAPSVLLVFGGDGSGKTSMALELLRRRQGAGHQCIALDPHAHPGKWPGCEVVGGGLAFGAIEQAIDKLQSILRQRYGQIASGEVAPGRFPPITVACEELTDWQASVANADLLIRKAGDYRKANIHLLMVAHGDSMSQIGAPAGSNEVIKNCVTKLRLISQPGADGRPVPAMRGELAYPLQAPFAVTVPRFTASAPETPRPTPETSTPSGFGGDTPGHFAFHETPETAPKRPDSLPSAPPETGADGDAPTGQECRELFFRLKDIGLNQTQIIKAIWGCTPGSSPAYKMARDFYIRLDSEYQQIHGGDAA